MTDKTANILSERKGTHGDYTDNARVSQKIKEVMQREPGWDELNHCQKESLDMFAHKIARILGGNPNHHDHWDDIAGYARLVSERIPNSKPSSNQIYKEAVNKFVEETPQQNVTGIPGKDKIYKCQTCGETFMTAEEVLSHQEQASHVAYSVPRAEDWEWIKAGTPEDGGHHVRDFLCPNCGDIFDSKEAMQKHNHEKHGGIPYQTPTYSCQHCGAAFHTKEIFHLHLANVHGMTRNRM